MIPTPRALAELALRRQEELSLQLSTAQSTTGASLLPDVLRRAIMTVSVCHETFRALQAALENGGSGHDGRGPSTPLPRESGWDVRGRYGFVADLINGAGLHEIGNGGKLGRAHLALAVDSALLAYGDLLCAADQAAQRRALDSLLEYFETLEVDSGSGPNAGLNPIAVGSRKIRVVLDARRSSSDSSNSHYRDLESFAIEGTAWSYCAALLAEAFRRGAEGAADVRVAVRRVDEIRAGLERPSIPGTPPASARTSFEERTRLSPDQPKS
ncbi:MAG TPA: hypothetical protein VKG01_15015 [Thermoanaerobaculia bacterium]|nr:hypothetical protein [Thermoanaerobaculia bacterium]